MTRKTRPEERVTILFATECGSLPHLRRRSIFEIRFEAKISSNRISACRPLKESGRSDILMRLDRRRASSPGGRDGLSDRSVCRRRGRRRSLTRLARHASIAELAKRVRGARSSPPGLELLPRRREGRNLQKTAAKASLPEFAIDRRRLSAVHRPGDSESKARSAVNFHGMQ